MHSLTVFLYRYPIIPFFKSLHLYKLTVIKRSMMISSSKISVVQMNSTSDKKSNLNEVQKLVENAAFAGAKTIFLPECCDYVADSKRQAIDLAETICGPTVKSYCQLASKYNVYLSIGGIHLKDEENSSKVKNGHLIISDTGKIIANYSKAHLFDVSVDSISSHESSYVEKGQEIPVPVKIPCGILGLGICYDLRFPEFSMIQRNMGAQILSYPSAFTEKTGKAHWHALLRARAIETQCYVAAAAQCGKHNDKRHSYGHAMIVDPWGKIIAESESYIKSSHYTIANIDLDHLGKIRKDFPVMSHRRLDLYSIEQSFNFQSNQPRLTEILAFPNDYISYKFHKIILEATCVFLRTLASLAIVNIKPILPGHVMVIPQRPVQLLSEMSSFEISDFAQTIVLTFKILSSRYNPVNVQFAIQEGIHAGQTVKHVHAHLIAIETPDSLDFLENHESRATKPKSPQEMAENAADLRNCVSRVSGSYNNMTIDNLPSILSLEDLVPLNENEVPSEFYLNENVVPSEFYLNENIVVPRWNIFGVSCFSVAFIPNNQVLPGHVCVTPKRNVRSIEELQPCEVVDMMLLIQLLQKTLLLHFQLSSFTVYADNFSTADSTKSNLCIHVVPRDEKDLKNSDDIYALLLNFEIDFDKENFSEKIQNFVDVLKSKIYSH